MFVFSLLLALVFFLLSPGSFFRRRFFVLFSPVSPSVLRSSSFFFSVLVANNRKLMPMIRKKERGGCNRRERGQKASFLPKNEKRTERESALARAPFFTFPSYTRKCASAGGGKKGNRAINKRERVASRPSVLSSLLSLSLSSLARFSSSSFFFHLFYFFSFFQRIKLLSGRWRGSPPWPWRVSVF